MVMAEESSISHLLWRAGKKFKAEGQTFGLKSENNLAITFGKADVRIIPKVRKQHF